MKKKDIRKFMREKREFKMEIVSPRGTSCRLYEAPPGTRFYNEREREEIQALAVRAFMEQEMEIINEQNLRSRIQTE